MTDKELGVEMQLVKSVVSVNAHSLLSRLTLPLRRGRKIEPEILRRREIRPIIHQIDPEMAGAYVTRVIRGVDLPVLREGEFPPWVMDRGDKSLNIKQVTLLESLEACEQPIPEELDFVVDSSSTRKALLGFLNPLFLTTDAENRRILFDAWNARLEITFKFLNREARRALFEILDGEEREALFCFLIDLGSAQDQTDFAKLTYDLDRPMYESLMRPWLVMEEN